ncbi:uncharacterized protein METZ01_LOCUS513877, partial [marine metagenome]
PFKEREAAWARLASGLTPSTLDALTEIVPLEAVPELADQILKGETRGRIVVKI